MTAVEWFIKELDRELCLEDCCDDFEWQFENLINKALEMEKHQKEISDEEIDNYADDKMTTLELYQGFISGAKWYREQLKKVK